jgi:DUF4097 and DUF4098 domain-containing protein YvlB
VKKVSSLRGVLALTVLAAASAGSAACDIALGSFSEQQTERWSNKYELQPGARFELRNVNGRIRVEPSTGRTVEVDAEKVGRAGSIDAAKEALARVHIEEDASGGNLRITTRVERTGGLNQTNVSVTYTVRVPRDVQLDFSTTNGGIEASGIDAPAKLVTTNGGIEAREMGGLVEARTTNGGLDIDLARIADGGVTLECTNGGIDLRLPADGRASIDARITNGGIDTSGLKLEASETSRRRLRATMNGGGPRIDVTCTNGGLDISSR